MTNLYSYTNFLNHELFNVKKKSKFLLKINVGIWYLPIVGNLMALSSNKALKINRYSRVNDFNLITVKQIIKPLFL